MKHEIMVIEDDPEIREALSEILEFEGYSTRMAVNGKDALQKLNEEVPALILMDLCMPVMNGAETLAALEKDTRLAKIPVIAMSAGDEKAGSPMVRLTVRKPMDIRHLTTKIKEILGQDCLRASPGAVCEMT